MFSSKNSKNGSQNSTTTLVANRINKDCSVQGNIVSQTDIRIDGTIVGDVESAAKIVIGSTGNVLGQIRCEDLTVEGIVEGDIFVNKTLFLRKTSKIGQFTVRFKKIIIEEGANIQCQLLPIENTEVNYGEERSE